MRLTMSEACELTKKLRSEQAKEHRSKVTQGDYCRGLTDTEYNKLSIQGKGAGSKGHKHSFTKLWSYHNSGVKIKLNITK